MRWFYFPAPRALADTLTATAALGCAAAVLLFLPRAAAQLSLPSAPPAFGRLVPVPSGHRVLGHLLGLWLAGATLLLPALAAACLYGHVDRVFLAGLARLVVLTGLASSAALFWTHLLRGGFGALASALWVAGCAASSGVRPEAWPEPVRVVLRLVLPDLGTFRPPLPGQPLSSEPWVWAYGIVWSALPLTLAAILSHRPFDRRLRAADPDPA